MSEQPLLFFISFLRIYSFILLARAIISWLPTLQGSRLSMILYMLTEPYVSLFRFKRASLGTLDLSFLWAYMFLTLLLNVLAQIAYTGSLSLVSLLSLLLGMVISIINFLLLVYALMIIIRLLTYKSTSPRTLQMNYVLDQFLSPFIQKIKSMQGNKKFVSHQRQLVYLLLATLVVSLLFSVVVHLLQNLLTILML